MKWDLQAYTNAIAAVQAGVPYPNTQGMSEFQANQRKDYYWACKFWGEVLCRPDGPCGYLNEIQAGYPVIGSLDYEVPPVDAERDPDWKIGYHHAMARMGGDVLHSFTGKTADIGGILATCRDWYGTADGRDARANFGLPACSFFGGMSDVDFVTKVSLSLSDGHELAMRACRAEKARRTRDTSGIQMPTGVSGPQSSYDYV